MRFRASIRNINTFIKLAASLSSLGKVAWARLDNDEVRFTVIPEQGTQVWAVLSADALFEEYNIQSATTSNTINLELPLGPFLSALRSAQSATSASLRLTIKDKLPLLALTIVTSTTLTAVNRSLGNARSPIHSNVEIDDARDDSFHFAADQPRDSNTTITQDIPIRVLPPHSVAGLHEPRCREPDVNIILPSLAQLKAISERFTKLAIASSRKPGAGLQSSLGPHLELAASMHGELRIGIKTEGLRIESRWNDLNNPALDPKEIEGGEEGLQEHPSTKMRQKRGEDRWAVVRVEGRDWSRVLGVGRLGGRVIACFSHEHALILYAYPPGDEDGAGEFCLTYYISSYSA